MAVKSFLNSGNPNMTVRAALAAGMALVMLPSSAFAEPEGGRHGYWGGGEARGGGDENRRGDDNRRADSGGSAGGWAQRQQSAPPVQAQAAPAPQQRGYEGTPQRQRYLPQQQQTAPQAQAQPQAHPQAQGWNGGNPARGAGWTANAAPQQQNRGTNWDQGRSNGNRDDRWRSEQRGNQQGDNRDRGSVWRPGRENGGSWQGDRGRNPGPNRGEVYRGESYRQWNRDWRRDNRYDWSDWRRDNRDTYRLGRYYSPYRNWSYRRLGIGFVLDNLFFGSDYWIADPWAYRLPQAYGPYRWVRYYDDALLVDIYSGRVVDVIYDIFW